MATIIHKPLRSPDEAKRNPGLLLTRMVLPRITLRFIRIYASPCRPFVRREDGRRFDFQDSSRCGGNVAPLPPPAAGRGRGWGVLRQTRCRKSKPIDPPTPPRHAQGRVEGGERTVHASAISPRVSREVLPVRSALSDQGAGNAGRPMRPIAACAMSVVERTRVSQVTPANTRHSPRNGLRLTSCSSRRSGFFVTVTGENLFSPT